MEILLLSVILAVLAMWFVMWFINDVANEVGKIWRICGPSDQRVREVWQNLGGKWRKLWSKS